MAVAIVNVVDFEFFSFIGKKLTFDVFDMGSDIEAQAFQLIFYYWYLTLMCLFLFFFLWIYYPKKKKDIMYKKKISKHLAFISGFTILIFSFILIRGGVQMRSLSPKDAFIFDHYELGNLALNSGYTLVRSLGNKGVSNISYFETDQLAVNKIKKTRDFENKFKDNRYANKNIVLIILESFSMEYIKKGYAPFLDSLMSKSISFENSFANGRRSIEALPSILTGFPSVIGKPLSQSQYQSNEFISLPYILAKNNYSTHFFHGGKKGTMDFDSYVKSIGVDHYHALEDYPEQKHYDGHWGIFDHYYLEYFGNELDKIATPFFSTIFTLSSHQPYTIPKSISMSFPKGDLDIHESIGYVDYSLKRFFNQIKTKDWYSNTLFIITADHTQKLEDKSAISSLENYRVPIIFYMPGLDLIKPDVEKTVQHVDILPSVLDFLNIDRSNLLLFGASVFNSDPGVMFNFISGNYLYYKRPYFLEFNNENSSIFRLENEVITKENVKVHSDLFDELKAYIQYTNNGLKNNNIYKIDTDTTSQSP